MLNLIPQFLDEYFKKLGELDIDYSNFILDHIAFMTVDRLDYDKKKMELQSATEFLSEKMVGDVLVGIFKFKTPMIYKNLSVSSMELLFNTKPKDDFTGWEHVEMIVPEGLEYLLSRYPHLNWDSSRKDRDEFPMIKLRLSPTMQAKFPRNPILTEYLRVSKHEL